MVIVLFSAESHFADEETDLVRSQSSPNTMYLISGGAEKLEPGSLTPRTDTQHTQSHLYCVSLHKLTKKMSPFSLPFPFPTRQTFPWFTFSLLRLLSWSALMYFMCVLPRESHPVLHDILEGLPGHREFFKKTTDRDMWSVTQIFIICTHISRI